MTVLKKFNELLALKGSEVEEWVQNYNSTKVPLPYFSCDVRHSKFKMGVVDRNLFPAGFNNLCPSFQRQTSEAFKNFFQKNYPAVQNIALLAESHTRNKFYLINVYTLQTLLEKAGFTVRVTMILDELKDSQSFQLDEEKTLTIYKSSIKDANLYCGDFKSDLILSNNDFSSGFPEELRALKDKVIPGENFGWTKRRKSESFGRIEKALNEFGNHFNIDPWLFYPYFDSCAVTAADLNTAGQKIDDLIKRIQTKYNEYGIEDQPYVFVKNDSGTYGMGIVSVQSGEEFINLGRRKKNKLFSSKGNNQSTEFLIQEGIPTADLYSEQPMESVIYGVGGKSIGGFFRLHNSKNQTESLNSPGMSFACLCLHKLDEPHESDYIDCEEKRSLVRAAKMLAEI